MFLSPAFIRYSVFHLIAAAWMPIVNADDFAAQTRLNEIQVVGTHNSYHGTPIYLCTEPVDFRKGFDGLTGIVTAQLGQSVTSGSVFLFVNRKRDRIKALWWETGGLTLWYRRLEQGTVELPKNNDNTHVTTHVTIDNVELAMWIAGIPLKSASVRRKRMAA